MEPPYVPAASRFPSADETMHSQFCAGRLAGAQVLPELVERQIGPDTIDPPDTAASLIPSADEATEYQAMEGRLFEVQVIPEFVEV